jgi:hypothetical protein
MASNLYEYYTSQGQALPTVSERAKLYSSYGLGTDAYVGSATQNSALLSALSSGKTIATPQTATPQSTPTVQNTPTTTQPTQGYDINSIVEAMMSKGYNNRAEAEAVAKADPERFAREYLGIGNTSTSGMTAVPSLDLTSLYNDLYNKEGISSLEADYTKLKTSYDTAVSKINDNPYLSEATRVGRVAKLTTDFNNQASTIQNKINSAKTNVETKIGLATKQYDITSQAAQQALSNFNSLLSSGALNDASPSTIASLAASTGLSTDMINSAINASKQTKANTQVIQSTDNNGNVTVSVINSDTGEVVNQTSLGQIATSKSSSSGGSKETNYKTSFLDDAKTITGQQTESGWVGQFPLLVAKYAPYMTLTEIYKLYTQTDLYKQFGDPTESAAEIKELYNYYRGNA